MTQGLTIGQIGIKNKMADVEVTNNLSESPNSKKRKLDTETDNYEPVIHCNIQDLSTFKIKKILNNNTKSKSVCLQGSFDNLSGAGLVILEKTAFEEDNLKPESDYFKSSSVLRKLFHNDIYGNYEYFPKAELNSIKTTIIHPASNKHIQKYSVQNPYIVDETPKIYEEIVLPFIAEEQFNLQWVYNILDHKSEVDRIVYEDLDPEKGFVLLPDLKWNGTTLDTLYLLAIVRVHDIKSIRDLTANHLPLLKNIKEAGIKAITDKYGVNSSQLRIYLHYQPSFYHLHVHFTYLRHEAPGILAERAHLLSNVISNIELLSDYYQKVTLPFVVRECDNLFKKFEEKGLLKKVLVQGN